MILKEDNSHLPYHILRRLLLIFSFLGQDENTDIDQIFKRFLDQNVFSF